MKLAPIFGVSLALFLTACGVDFTASTASGDSYQAAVRQADEARSSGDLQTAIALYGRALQADPEGVEAKLGLGETYLSIGAPEEAAAQFRDVLAQRSGNAVARRGLAAALIGMNQPELAEQQLDTALQADAREGTAQLARKLGLARTTVVARIARLERSGVVAGYGVRLGQRLDARRRFDAAWRERWGGEPYSGDSKPMQRRGRLVFDASFAATIDGARVTFHPGDPVPDNLDPAALPVGVCKEQLS